ncbi:MAG: GldG family protein, partial [Candidatus Atribacteria bacterium]|nr:GldG family protein [Candidatus Atribacteria bacterium]
MAKTKNSQKKNNPKKFAIIGLWVFGIALLATILLLVVKLLAVAKIYTLPNAQVFNWALGISAALIVLGVAFFALLDPQRVRELLTGRQARYGSNAAIMLLAFVGILLVVNILVLQNPGKPMDFTEDKQNSLAAETLDTLKALPASVQATAFYTSQTPSDTAQKLLENYKKQSNGKFDYVFIDPDQTPLLARQAGITGDGKIYLQMGDQHEIVSYASEQDITSALVRLMNPGQRTIYFLTGHGERDIQNAGDTAYTTGKSALEAKNYTVQSLNLIAQNKIPDNATVIVIVGPTQPISAAEQALLQDYVSKGGALVVMEEPAPLTQFGNSPDPLAAYLAANWGIAFDNDIAIDTNTSQPVYAVAATYGNHPIT